MIAHNPEWTIEDTKWYEIQNIPRVGQAIIIGTWHISCTYLVLIKFPLRLSVKQCHKGKFSIIKSKEWSESNVYILLLLSWVI